MCGLLVIYVIFCIYDYLIYDITLNILFDKNMNDTKWYKILLLTSLKWFIKEA